MQVWKPRRQAARQLVVGKTVTLSPAGAAGSSCSRRCLSWVCDLDVLYVHALPIKYQVIRVAFQRRMTHAQYVRATHT